MASGFLPVTFILPVTANVFKSKTVTELSRPLLVKPLLRDETAAIP